MAKFLVITTLNEKGQNQDIRINLEYLVEVQDIILADGSRSELQRYVLSTGKTYDAITARETIEL